MVTYKGSDEEPPYIDPISSSDVLPVTVEFADLLDKLGVAFTSVAAFIDVDVFPTSGLTIGANSPVTPANGSSVTPPSPAFQDLNKTVLLYLFGSVEGEYLVTVSVPTSDFTNNISRSFRVKVIPR